MQELISSIRPRIRQTQDRFRISERKCPSKLARVHPESNRKVHDDRHRKLTVELIKKDPVARKTDHIALPDPNTGF